MKTLKFWICVNGKRMFGPYSLRPLAEKMFATTKALYGNRVTLEEGK